LRVVIFNWNIIILSIGKHNGGQSQLAVIIFTMWGALFNCNCQGVSTYLWQAGNYGA